MNRHTTITRPLLVLTGIVVGAVLVWACGNAGNGPPNAHAAETACKTWKVKSFPVGKTQELEEYELPEGYEPIGGDGDYTKIYWVLGKKCVAP